MKIKRTEFVDVDLSQIPYKEWPQEAKNAAFDVLISQRNLLQFKAMEYTQRKEWLIKRIEARQKLLTEWDEFAIKQKDD